ncbi:hypothetical protein [Aquimarina algicola]|uniref:ABC transporter permease n=1 Tax=Aquimarina algicola TaxID=2589995 RepID=A0A504IY30_9FLAO|nr:hypothetical protein [Aquimarina algicola]TPN83356.1 hypothetical protein FHK87_19230 [Aquimarina algicola]
MEELMDKTQQFMYNNPQYPYLILGIVCAILSFGNFKRKKWALNLSSFRQRMLYSFVGEKRFQIVLAIFYAIVALSSFVGSYLYASGIGYSK